MARAAKPRRRTKKRKIQKEKVARSRKMPLTLVFNNMKQDVTSVFRSARGVLWNASHPRGATCVCDHDKD